MCAVVCSDASFNLNLPESTKNDLLLRVQKEKLSEAEENRLFSEEEKRYSDEIHKKYFVDWPTFGDAS